MDYIRILFYMLLHVFGFGGCFQFTKTDGSMPDRTLDNMQQDEGGINYRQLVPGTVPPTLVTCTCVPPGSCPVAPTLAPTLAPDGSGQIDIRIVNNVSVLKVSEK